MNRFGIALLVVIFLIAAGAGYVQWNKYQQEQIILQQIKEAKEREIKAIEDFQKQGDPIKNIRKGGF